MSYRLQEELRLIYSRTAEKLQEELSVGPEAWGFYKEGWDVYGGIFQPIIPEGWKQFFLDKSRFGLKSGMDVFGEGQVLRDLIGCSRLETGIAITLTDLRPPEDIDFDLKHNIHLVEGNAWRGILWRKVRELQKLSLATERGSGVIFFSPVGAFSLGEFQSPSFETTLMILNKMWHCLSPGGTLLAHLPTWSSYTNWDFAKKFSGWERMASSRGIKVNSKPWGEETNYKSLLRLDRTAQSPDSLPLPNPGQCWF